MLLKKDELENLLLVNWHHYFDHHKLFQYVTDNILNNINKFLSCQGKNIIINKKISISSIKLINEGFLVWVEFKIPHEHRLYVGTNELVLSCSGEILNSKINGNYYNLSDLGDI